MISQISSWQLTITQTRSTTPCHDPWGEVDPPGADLGSTVVHKCEMVCEDVNVNRQSMWLKFVLPGWVDNVGSDATLTNVSAATGAVLLCAMWLWSAGQLSCAGLIQFLPCHWHVYVIHSI